MGSSGAAVEPPVAIAGADVDALNNRERRARPPPRLRPPAVLPLEGLSAVENVDRACSTRGALATERRRRARRWSGSAGAPHGAPSRPELSGGERQRVAIARAVWPARDGVGRRANRQPRLAHGERDHGLARRAQREGATIVVITHDHGVAAPAARTCSYVTVASWKTRVGARRAAPARRSAARQHRRLALAARRAALSVLGVAIGIAGMVSVLGLSASSRTGLLDELDRLGTNLLTAANGKTIGGDEAELPRRDRKVIARLEGVLRSRRSARWTPPSTATRIRPARPAGSPWRSPTQNCPRCSCHAGARAFPRRGDRDPRPSYSAHSPPTSGHRPPGPYRSTSVTAARRSSASWHVEVAPREDVRAGRLPGGPPRAGRRAQREHRLPGRRPSHGRPRPRAAALGPSTRPTRERGSRPSVSATARPAADSALTMLLLGLGAVALLVGGMASPTPWSSRCWNGRRRSGCAARSARPAAMCAPSSSWSRCCSASGGRHGRGGDRALVTGARPPRGLADGGPAGRWPAAWPAV